MATDATGTPTTKFSIPKFNTAVDSPSGKGTNAMMDSIDASMANLGVGTIVNNDVPIWNSGTGKWGKTSGTPSSSTFLRGDGQWFAPAPYRKTTAKTAVNTTAETDLFNGEILIGAGLLGTTGVLRMTAWGDWINNSGLAQASPRIRVKYGGTNVAFDTGAIAGAWATNASSWGWRVQYEQINLGSVTSQYSTFQLVGSGSWANNSFAAFLSGSGQYSTNASDQIYGNAVSSGPGADTSTALQLFLTVILPVASASVSMTLRGAVVEIL